MARRGTSYRRFRDSVEEEDDLCAARRYRRSPERRDSPEHDRWDPAQDLPGPPERQRDASPRDHFRSDHRYERDVSRRRSPESSFRHRGDDYDRRSVDDPATHTLIVKGIPDSWTEQDICEVCAEYSDAIRDIRRVMRRGRGDESLEFHTVNTAESAMDGWLYDVLDRAGVHRISLDFAQPLVSSKGVDWNCEVCDVRNFARRETCIKCRAPRDSINREEDVKVLVAEYGAASDVQLLQSRCYINFSQISESQRALEALDGVRCGDEYSQRLAVSFAPGQSGDSLPSLLRRRDSDRDRSQLANEAVAAAAAMNAYHPQSITAPASEAGGAWQPRSFSIAALSEIEQTKGLSGNAENTPGGGAPNPATDTSAEGGFVYDEASGYYYDAASGYFYDVATQLYYHPSTQAWYRHNAETGEYDVIPAGESASESAQGGSAALKLIPSSGDAAASGQDVQISATSQQGNTVLDQLAGAPAQVAAKPGSEPAASQRKTAAQKKALVNDFLKRKAEEQRQAARDFLKTEAAPPQDIRNAEPPAKVQCTSTAVAQGVVRQKTYSSSQHPSEALVTPSESTLVQAVAGGVIRGKSYRRAG